MNLVNGDFGPASSLAAAPAHRDPPSAVDADSMAGVAAALRADLRTAGGIYTPHKFGQVKCMGGRPAKQHSPSSVPVMAAEEAKSKSDAEWRAALSEEQYRVLRRKGTERAGTGEYDKFYPKEGEGYFACAGCGAPLYSASAKFNSGCGWPAFDKCYAGAITTHTDADGRRVEIVCTACGGHMGHVFKSERFTPTNERHCVNSVSIKFVKGPLPDGAVSEEKKVL